MADENGWISLFSSEFSPENSNAMDWGPCGFAAFATGSTIHFFNIEDSLIKRLYSTNFRAKSITSIKFHNSSRRLAIGDDSGRIILWDVDLRAGFGSSLVFPNQNASCIDMKWIKSTLLVLFSNNHLVSLTHSSNKHSDFYVNMTLQWDLSLLVPFNKLSVQYNEKVDILLTNSSSQLAFYTTDSPTTLPKQKYDVFELSKTHQIIDAQFSYHFPDFIFIVFENEISLFHLHTQSIITLIVTRGVASSFVNFLQDEEDHLKLTVLLKNGIINIYKANEELKYTLENEIKPKYVTSQMSKILQNFLVPKKLLIYLDKFGFSLFDVEKNTIISLLPYFPSSITCSDSYKNKYVLGNSDGFVITGNFNNNQIQKYSVSKERIEYVFMCQNSLIFWATKSSVGKIDILTRKVSEFKCRLKIIRKIKATRNGGLAVQREKDLLSLFINDKEVPQILQKPLIDFCLDENSDSQRGLISFILSNNDILFYPYDRSGFQKLTGKFKINNNDAIPRSLSVNKSDICISFDNGTIILFTIGQQNSTRIVTTMKDIYNIQHLDYPQGVNRSVSNESMKCDDSCENLSSISLNDDNNQLNPDEVTTFYNNEVLNQNKQIANDTKSDKTSHQDIKSDKTSYNYTKSGKNDEISNIDQKIISNDEQTKIDDKNKIDRGQNSSVNYDKNRINLKETKSDKQNKRSERRVILGISEKNELFILDKRVRICPIPVLMASPCGYDNESVLALCTDGVTRLIRLKDWQPYSKISLGNSFLSPPKIDNFNRNKIVNYNSEYLRYDSYEIRNAMKSNPPLSLMTKYCCGFNTLQVPKSLLILLEKISKSSQKIENMKFNASLFSDDFEKASEYLLSAGPNSHGFVKNAALSGCLVSSNLQNEKFIAHLKSIASSLFLTNRFEDGSLFMRIIKNDYAAADYLIEVGQFEMAKSFIYLLGKEEKKSILSKMALFLYRKGDKKESICLFISAEEFHPALCVMQELNMVLDSYHVKKIAEERSLLKQTENKTLKQIIGLFDFDTLCTKIDMDYSNACKKLGII